MRNVGAIAQVNKGPTSVNSGGGVVENLAPDEVLFVLVVLEHFEEVFLGHYKALKGLLLADSPGSKGLKGVVIAVQNGAN